ncbi:MAG: heparinase II/III family protein [Verrucomicrobia bacterium]|nr:heparinase II/III family protein [Verrucomicrobiota bacterium]
MNQTRRDFLHTTSLLAAALPLAGFTADAAEPNPMKTPSAPAGAVRRGLLFDDADLPRIRANTTHPRFAAMWQEMLAADLAADADFIEHKVRLTNHTIDLLHVQKILDRAAFIYLVNRDPKQADLARLAMRKMVEYPEWDSFIEGGRQVLGLQRATEGTFSLLLALDCLAEVVTPEERAAVEAAILTKGVPACYTAVYGMKYPDRVKGWDWNPRSDLDPGLRRISLKRWPLILAATNLRIIPTSCLGIAACHFRGRRPEADSWLELARSSAKAFSTMYGSDGCYDEGVSYWGYTTLYLALFAEVLWRTQGIDDRQLINYPGSVRYALTMTNPTINDHRKLQDFEHIKGWTMPTIKPEYDVVNFGDANGAVDVSVAAWVRRTHGDPVSQYVAKEIGEAKFVYGLVWFDPAASEAEPETALLDHRMTNDLVVSRTGWHALDNVLALRSGGPANHEHADRNSVIFKAYGERLLHDPFRAAYVATQPRWLLRQTEAHTAVLINGRGHQYHDGSEGTNSSWAVARVIGYAAGAGWMTVTSDATEAYSLVNEAVTRVHRTLVYVKPDVVVFVDRVAVRGGAAVQLRFQVFHEDGAGEVRAEGGGFRINRPHASLLARVAPAPNRVVRTGRLNLEEKDGVYPFAEIESPAATEHEIVTVCSARPSGSEHGTLTISGAPGAWRIEGTHGGQAIKVSITSAGDAAPVVTV